MQLFFYAQLCCWHCKRYISYSNSFRLSVRLSVCLSVRSPVTRRYCVKTTARSTAQFAPLDSNNKGTRGHLAKLSKPRCQKAVRKYFFSHRVIDRWNAYQPVTKHFVCCCYFLNNCVSTMAMYIHWLACYVRISQ